MKLIKRKNGMQHHWVTNKGESYSYMALGRLKQVVKIALEENKVKPHQYEMYKGSDLKQSLWLVCVRFNLI